jgi:SAM-dependent methyltransferase
MRVGAEEFDRWYANKVESPAVDGLAQRVLGLPPEMRSTSLLTWGGLAEVVAALGVREGQVVLDLACGQGGYGLEIARRCGVRVVGVDFSVVAIGQARRRARELRLAQRARFWVGELARTGLVAAAVDAVVIVDAIQFSGSVRDTLAECRRVLVPGGRAAITCWEALDTADERLPERVRQIDLAGQLAQAGFVDVEVAERPAWRRVEREFWEGALALDAADDPAVESMQEEARRVLSAFDAVRRVLATATAPG